LDREFFLGAESAAAGMKHDFNVAGIPAEQLRDLLMVV
jgi:hypothetical protein